MKIMTLKEMLPIAQNHHYGIGTFSPRNTFLIEAILQAAENTQSPVIVQISSNELGWFDCSAKTFADRFYALKDRFTIPAVLHLDHTKDLGRIKEAIEAGFTSVMIDASALEFNENVAITREVVEYAHARGVSVEAELGRILATDKIETDADSLLYTVPEEAAEFVSKTGVDALAVSVGSAHGVYPVKDPKIDYERIELIRKLISTPLVLHGGSGLPAKTVQKAITLPSGGVSKINIATDLEIEFQRILQVSRMPDVDVWKIDAAKLAEAGKAVQALVEDRIVNFLQSNGRASDYK
jgi:ketose-bisphosphate aldolase